MTTPSGPIRKQLGPARKRLSTRIKEITDAIQSNDVGALKTLRPKLTANLLYLNGVVEKLQGIEITDEDSYKRKI